MTDNNLRKLINYTIYSLIFILSILIIYNAYLIYSNITLSKTPPKNSVRVSPLTGEEFTNVSSSKNILKVIYNKNSNSYGSLSSASIIFEEVENNIWNIYALFMEDDLCRDSTMDIVSEYYSNDLPIINFNSPPGISCSIIDTVNINYSNKDSSNFIFFNNTYYHFYNNCEDLDSSTSNTVSYNNIIIDISTLENNTILVFSKGKCYKQLKSTPLYLSKGKSYWITLKKDDSINIFNNKLEESLNK